MGNIKQINIKNYYFYNNIINIEEFNSNLLKIDRKSHKDLGIYYIGYITIKKLVIMTIFTVQILCIWWLVK